jgi:hypothetical protein
MRCWHKWDHGTGITLENTPVMVRRCSKCGMVQRNDYHGEGWTEWKQMKDVSHLANTKSST